MRFVLVFTILFKISLSHAQNYGDHHCNIFTKKITRETSPRIKYTLEIVVTEVMLKNDFQRFDLFVTSLDSHANVFTGKMIERNSKQRTYEMYVLPSSNDLNSPFSVIASMTNGEISLYDNNFSGKMIELNAQNRWSYQSTNCR